MGKVYQVALAEQQIRYQSTDSKEDRESFEFREDKSFASRCLQAICVGLLSKLKAYRRYTLTSPEVRYYTFELSEGSINELSEFLCEFVRSWSARPRYILIGAKNFQKMVVASKDVPALSGPVELPFNLYNAQIIVVPWLDGVFPLPEDLEVTRHG